MPLVVNRSGVDLFLTDGQTIRILPTGATNLDNGELRKVQGVLIHPEHPICYRDQFLCSGAFDCSGGGTLIFDLEDGLIKIKESLQAKRYYLEDGEIKSKGDWVADNILSSYVDIRSTFNRPGWDLMNPSISPLEGSLAGWRLSRENLRPSPQGRIVRDFADGILSFLDSNTVLEISARDRQLVEQFCALLIEIATSIGPLGVGRSFYEFVSGKNFVDDTELSTFERATAFLELISLGLSKIAKIDDILRNVGDLAKVLFEILERIGDAASALVMRQVRKTVKNIKELGLEEWAFVRLTARGIERVKNYDLAVARLEELSGGAIEGIDEFLQQLRKKKMLVETTIDKPRMLVENTKRLDGQLAEAEALDLLLQSGTRIKVVSKEITISPLRPGRPGESRPPRDEGELDIVSLKNGVVVATEIKSGKPKNIKLDQLLDQVHWATHVPDGVAENIKKFRILSEGRLGQQKKESWTRQMREINDDLEIEFLEF